MNTLKTLGVASAILLVCACRHPLEIRGKGEGDILSASGDRDCALEDYQGGLANCTDNVVEGTYAETYTAAPRPGSQFRRWGNYCGQSTDNQCSFTAPASVVDNFAGKEVKALQAIFRPTVNTGLNALLMGHSFFIPFSYHIRAHAVAAGFVDHYTKALSGSGNEGTPSGFLDKPYASWVIRNELDSGTYDLFGMSYFTAAPDIDAYREWVAYALAANPDTRIFIAAPWPVSPTEMTAAQYEAAYHHDHDTIAHGLVDTLRADFPGAEIYCIPYGQGAVELYKLLDEGNLPDVSALVGPQDTALFQDEAGHHSDILQSLGLLIWLGAIYEVDLDSYSYDPGYTTDLKAMAQSILASHDPAYNTLPHTYPDADGDGLPDRLDTDDDDDGLADAEDPCPLDATNSC